MLPLIVLVGPTAVGKTHLGVELALRLGGEIISGDSMQVYRYMDIGTAKIKPSEMRGIAHHLIDIKDPDEPFSVAEFQKLATQKIAEISARGKLPMIVGGTGLYIQAVIDPYEFTEQPAVSGYRKELQSLAQRYGNKYLHEKLSEVDPLAAGNIHENDFKRITRALEYYHVTGGKRISENKIVKTKKLPEKYNLVWLGLTMERQDLYRRIGQRADRMIEEGFVAEVENLLQRGYSPGLSSLQGIGYRQLIGYLQGQCDLAEAVELIKRDTRHFAKRQLTWFKRDPRIHWFNTKCLEKNLFEIMAIIGRTINKSVE